MRKTLHSSHESSEAYNRAVAILANSTERFEYPLIPKGAITEQYRQGTIQIACVLDWPHLATEDGVVGRHNQLSLPIGRAKECFVGAADGVRKDKVGLAGQDDLDGRWKKQLVLIRNIQSVKVIEGQRAAGKGLQFGKDVIENGLARLTAWGLSLDGSFRAWPVLAERELDPIAPCSSVVLDHNPVRVIEADAKIIDSISDNQGCAIWHGQTHSGLPELPRVWVEFTLHGFDVRLDVTSKSLFKLADVMIGPFYFEKRPLHSEFSHA